MTFSIYVKVMRLTPTPHPRTNSKEGFHPSCIARKEMMLTLRTIPDTRRPLPKSRPVVQVIVWSRLTEVVWAYPSSLLFLNAIMPPIIGRRTPRTMLILAE